MMLILAVMLMFMGWAIGHEFGRQADDAAEVRDMADAEAWLAELRAAFADDESPSGVSQVQRHTVRFVCSVGWCSARCGCGWDAHSSDRAEVVDSAERHAHETRGRILTAGLPAVSAVSA